MCGRYTLSATPQELLTLFALSELPTLMPRYNIAPTQQIPVVRCIDSQGGPERRLHRIRWGLIPAWSKSGGEGKPLINARSETIEEKPSFREGYQKRRCLVPASGFYEWERSGSQKQPYYVGLTKWRTFAMAGIWEQWKSPSGEIIQSGCILTTEANPVLKPFHHRMPVILSPQDYATWLGGNPSELRPLLKPFPAAQMQAVAVSTYVNNTRNDDPSCIKPAPIQQKLF